MYSYYVEYKYRCNYNDKSNEHSEVILSEYIIPHLDEKNTLTSYLEDKYKGIDILEIKNIFMLRLEGHLHNI